MTTRLPLATFGLILALAAAGPALAQRAFGGFTEQSGKEIYENVCQSCHMADAKGAKGAGVYPGLAANPRLATKAYPAFLVVGGQKAMPEFGSSLNDTQVANVVNYIRTHFGNSYGDAMTPEEVKPLRPAPPVGTVASPG